MDFSALPNDLFMEIIIVDTLHLDLKLSIVTVMPLNLKFNNSEHVIYSKQKSTPYLSFVFEYYKLV
jgi:hypothetical protein